MAPNDTPFDFVHTNKALTLVQRKEIREYEATKTKTLQELEALTGIAFDFQVLGDVTEMITVLGDSEKNRLGEIIFQYHLGAIYDMFKSASKDKFIFDEFLSVLKDTKVIAVRPTTIPRESGGAYQVLTIENGRLINTFETQYAFTNIGEISSTNVATIKVIDTVIPDVDVVTTFVKENRSIPLLLRQNIRDNEEKVKKYLKDVETATGLVFEVDVEYAPILQHADVTADYKNRLADIFLDSYLENVSTLLKKKLADDMVKEAFLEAVTAPYSIVFGLADTKRDGGPYQRVKIANGKFRIEFDANEIWYNVGDLSSFELEAIL